MIRNKDKNGLLKKHFSSLVDNDYVRIKVVGVINTIAFQKARIWTEKLHQHLPFKFIRPEIIEMFQMNWFEYIQKQKRQIGGKIWSLKQPVAVFINDKFIGCDVDLLHYISEFYTFSLPIGIGYYESLAAERYKQFMEKSKRKYVYFTFTVDGCTIGSFIFMLYSDLLPLTCQHFLNLCTGYDDVTKCYKNSYYINTRVHRIVKNGWLQCGGIALPKINEESVNNITIPDELYCIPHDRRGILSLANSGKHCNESQFIVCLKPNPWMNYFYVAFGQLVDGAETLKILENMPTYYEHPIKQIVISYCGDYLFVDEPILETESKVIYKCRSSISVDREDTKLSDIAFNFYCNTSWLDDIVDRNVCDTESILMAERYLNDLYCLSINYLPGMDMCLCEETRLISKKNYDITSTDMLRELLLKFQPDLMTEKEKLMFIIEISKIILAYIFCYKDHKFCSKHISIDTCEIIHTIFEIAHKIASKTVAKTEISHKCGDLQTANIFEAKQVNADISVSKVCIPLLQDILNAAILCLMRTFDIHQ
ncbi:putative inactive peptidyl-prolyl cis-trans isomerase-like 6 [Colletes latitarsis]|uniref:putative inactive peptidyl-prolyl cis-trans isomerase-like 6 n=1 Tax=Colletes latitarsis TaxID=2605962 RepID=UPI004035586F